MASDILSNPWHAILESHGWLPGSIFAAFHSYVDRGQAILGRYVFV